MFSLSGSASEVLEAIDGDHGTSDIAVITATTLDASSQDIERNIDIVVFALTNYRLVDLVNCERFLVQKERTVLSPLKAFQDGQEQ